MRYLWTLLLLTALVAGCDSSSGGDDNGGGQDIAGAVDTVGGGGDEDVASVDDTGTVGETLAVSITSPEVDAFVGDSVVVSIAVSGPAVEVQLLDGNILLARDQEGLTEAGTVELTWTPDKDGSCDLVARAKAASGEWAMSETVAVVVDATAPVVAFDAPPMTVVTGDVELPFTIEEENVANVVVRVDDIELVTLDAAPAAPVVWPADSRLDGVHMVEVEVTDVAGNTVVGGPLPLIAADGGTVAETTLEPGPELYIPEQYYLVDYHTKLSTPSVEGVTRVIAWMRWESDIEWMIEFAMGQGTCPHNGVTYTVEESAAGYVWVDILRSELPADIVERFPVEYQENGTFPVNDDPRTFGQFFGHVAPSEPADHKEQRLPFESGIILFMDAE